MRKELIMASIRSIDFNLTGWDLIEESEENICWSNSMSDILLLSFFAFPLNIPVELKDLTSIQSFHRDLVGRVRGGLISVDLLTVGEMDVIKTTFKIPQQPFGMTYLGSLIFLFPDFNYIIKVQCEEHGMTGIRDTTVFMRLLNESNLESGLDEEFMKGWAQDPYDKTYTGSALRTLADDEKYDAQFPLHPLSRLRRYLACIETSICCSGR
jgi:hypothetical protein